MNTQEALGVIGSKLNAPEADRFVADYYPSLTQQIFYGTVRRTGGGSN